MRKSFLAAAALALLAGAATAAPAQPQSSQRVTAVIPYDPALPYVKDTTSAAVAQPVSPSMGTTTGRPPTTNPQMNNPHVNPVVNNPHVNNPRR